MCCLNLEGYRNRLNFFVAILVLFFLSEGCSSGNVKDSGKDKAIVLVQDYQIGGKSVKERLSYALQHSTNDKITAIEWSAIKERKNMYEVKCTVKADDKELHFTWLANLSSKRITPLDMTTQDIMGGGFY